ncbi:hypothetical protein D9615_002272 [Tricholomella constricta]|uniref:C2H2-type domain-containing protein n=1 Tax=Tricholomella constricta TaxID=117010 RepID=A0A8H5HMD3_9AGAR|nr:hypothetical protein D9615_002272 [Tricholomella constricta]
MAQPQPDAPLLPVSNQEEEEEEEEEDEWDEDDYDEGEDDDIDAEAEEIARRLGEELWADLSKATAGQIIGVAPAPAAGSSPQPDTTLFATSNSSRKGDAAILTMKAILTVVENDPPARHALASAIVPSSNDDNVLDTLKRLVASGGVSKATAVSLSPILVSLASSDILFGNLRHSNASSIQLVKGKRKREEVDDGLNPHDPQAFKRPYIPESGLENQVNEAVRVITQALVSSPAQPLDSNLVSSIRLQLHQVFLFAVTSSAGGGRDMHALQEISGLIQVIGVLSGIQIGQTPDSHSQHTHFPNPSYPWLPAQPPASSTDIGTAVYPCHIAGCKKMFSRLYSLRAHQRVHAIHRPFRCSTCPASFARNHDLKRHIKLHDKKAWKCAGCLKVFSRRDAIKRHKTGRKIRGPRSEACITAEVMEVELDQDEGEDSMREERNAKLWSGIANSQADAAVAQPLSHGYHDPTHMEEGEVQFGTISAMQSSVLSLHGLLQAHVGGALGTPMERPISPPMDPTAGQATLASVIARAQLQNMPTKTVSPAAGVDLTNAAPYHPVFNESLSQDQASAYTTITVGSSKDSAIPISSLSMYGLSDEQTKMLEEAIASAASAAQAQAEAEAALEEEEEDEDDLDDEEDESEGHVDTMQS